jgi:hypothetical protein
LTYLIDYNLLKFSEIFSIKKFKENYSEISDISREISQKIHQGKFELII